MTHSYLGWARPSFPQCQWAHWAKDTAILEYRCFWWTSPPGWETSHQAHHLLWLRHWGRGHIEWVLGISDELVRQENEGNDKTVLETLGFQEHLLLVYWLPRGIKDAECLSNNFWNNKIHLLIVKDNWINFSIWGRKKETKWETIRIQPTRVANVSWNYLA